MWRYITQQFRVSKDSSDEIDEWLNSFPKYNSTYESILIVGYVGTLDFVIVTIRVWDEK